MHTKTVTPEKISAEGAVSTFHFCSHSSDSTLPSTCGEYSHVSQELEGRKHHPFLFLPHSPLSSRVVNNHLPIRPLE